MLNFKLKMPFKVHFCCPCRRRYKGPLPSCYAPCIEANDNRLHLFSPNESAEVEVSPPPIPPASAPARPPTTATAPAAQPSTQERVQRETTCAAVLRARELALAAKALVPPPKGRLLRVFQKAEVKQKMAESKVILSFSFP